MYSNSSLMFSRTNFIYKRIGGFSLIEVLITSAIIGIVTAIVVVRYGAFNSSVLLRNQAYEVALAIREAQVYSVSVRGEEGNFRDAYGIHIENLPTQQYILFVDADEEVDTFTVDSRFEISEVCLGTASAPGCGKDSMTVTFKRPDFDANMRSSPAAGSLANRGAITLEPASRGSGTRTILIQSTGLISVE